MECTALYTAKHRENQFHDEGARMGEEGKGEERAGKGEELKGGGGG